MKAHFKKHTLIFKNPSGTSRGVLLKKDSWFLILSKDRKSGIGECSILKGLSYDDHPDFEKTLAMLCNQITRGETLLDLTSWPAIKMGYEMALLSLKGIHSYELFPSFFTKGSKSIPINGLVWMGSYDFMKQQIDALLSKGFNCIKIKIGALDFDEELRLIAQLRKRYDAKTISIRVDANGAFLFSEALSKLQKLSAFRLHSIEQPIATKQWENMAFLCKKTPIPIALDEELIGVFSKALQIQMLDQICPQYLVFKPTLLGGFSSTLQWLSLAKEKGIDWWITSALESNIGLNAIAQFTFLKNISLPQGLGTGSLFTNNIESPLVIKKGCLWTDNSISWKQI
jgi:o-succinylbenzoate synthase|tara:strand:- start:2411 stop:3436 length:1026 start_codon:yes stop_codon:yes gene_type:complete